MAGISPFSSFMRVSLSGWAVWLGSPQGKAFLAKGRRSIKSSSMSGTKALMHEDTRPRRCRGSVPGVKADLLAFRARMRAGPSVRAGAPVAAPAMLEPQ